MQVLNKIGAAQDRQKPDYRKRHRKKDSFEVGDSSVLNVNILVHF